MWIRIFKTWFKWRKDWDSICKRCGKCCYFRSYSANGEVRVHYDIPCEYLDEETHLCKVYEKRMKECDHCAKVDLYTALYEPTLPNDCAYRQMFRLWEQEK